MPTDRVTETFRENLHYWKIFGIWSGSTPNKRYKYYNFFCLTVAMVYDFFIVLNLFYTPRKLEIFIREIVFSFSEVNVACKVIAIMTKRRTIDKLFKILNCDTFNDEESNKIFDKQTRIYNICIKAFFYMINISCLLQSFLPIVRYLLVGTDIHFPICNFYFLKGEHRSSYFFWWYGYQGIFMYTHIVYNISIDSFMLGLIYLGLGQFKSLSQKITLLGVQKNEHSKIKRFAEAEENNRVIKLKTCLHQYDMLLTYCKLLQKLLGTTMFFQHGMATLAICATLYTLTKPLPTETGIFTTVYLIGITGEIFLPGWLGSRLTFENQQISIAVYNSNWIDASESYKRSLRLLVERANKPLVLTGLEMFPLSLDTFSSIMRMSYSFYTLLRSFQE